MTPAFTTFTDFLSMGKHGVFVWSAWGITLCMLLALVWVSRQQRQHIYKHIIRQQKRQQ